MATTAPTGSTPPSPVEGERLVLRGIVLLPDCRPAVGTELTIWHTDAAGRYGPLSPSGELNCCFYEAQLVVDANGRFELHTVRPATDPATDGTAELPPHIHVSVAGATNIDRDRSILFEGEDTGGDPFAAVIPLERRTDADGDHWFGYVELRLRPST